MKTMEKPSPETTKDDPKRRRKNQILTVVILIAAVLLPLLGALLTFSPYRDYSAPKLDEPHFLLLRRIATELRKNRKKQEAELRFSPEESGLMLDIVRQASSFAGRKRTLPPPENFMLEYRKNGGVFFAVPIDAAGEWCFGGKIYLSGVFSLEKEGYKVLPDMSGLSFGRADLPVPGGLDLLYPQWKDRVENALPQVFMDSVVRITTESDGTLVLVYHPQELRKPLKKQLVKLQKNCSDDLRMPLEQLINAL